MSHPEHVCTDCDKGHLSDNCMPMYIDGEEICLCEGCYHARCADLLELDTK